MFNPYAPSNSHSNLSSCYCKHELIKKRAYEQRVREIENPSSPHSCSLATGGLEVEAIVFNKRLASGHPLMSKDAKTCPCGHLVTPPHHPPLNGHLTPPHHHLMTTSSHPHTTHHVTPSHHPPLNDYLVTPSHYPPLNGHLTPSHHPPLNDYLVTPPRHPPLMATSSHPHTTHHLMATSHLTPPTT